MTGSEGRVSRLIRKTLSILISFLILGVGPQAAGYRLAAQEIDGPDLAAGASASGIAAGVPVSENALSPAALDIETNIPLNAALPNLPAPMPAAALSRQEMLPPSAQTGTLTQAPREEAPAAASSELATAPQPAENAQKHAPTAVTILSHQASVHPLAYLQLLKDKKFLRFLAGAKNPSASEEALSHDAQLALAASDEATPDSQLPAPPLSRRADLLRAVLSRGTKTNQGQRVNPFVFHVAGRQDEMFSARNAGLEGFAYSKREIESDLGPSSILHHLGQYFEYLDALLSPAREIPSVAGLQARVNALRGAKLNAAAKNTQLQNLLEDGIKTLQEEFRAARPSSWMQKARVYEIFPRAFNLEGWRAWRGRPQSSSSKKFFADFSSEDLADLKSMGYDAVWTMGIFPIGLRDRVGDAGGSPYSIQDHTAVNPELGTLEDFKGFVERAHAAGLKVVLDFVPNHTSQDSRLLAEHPEFFIHREVEGDAQKPPEGYFSYFSQKLNRWIWVSYGGYNSFGSRAYWKDTAQIDYSRQDTRDAMSAIAAEWVGRGVDGLRVDMAYQLVNAAFSGLWGRQTPHQEFLAQLMETGRKGNPSAAYVAEAYALRDALSDIGFDSIYNKNDMDTSEGQYGWYDAWMNGVSSDIRQAIREASFLTWQKGGATGLQFIGNHDEAAPQRQAAIGRRPISGLGRLWKAAALMTLLVPGNLLFYASQEIGFDHSDPSDFPKAVPFSVPVSVDWSAWAAQHPDIAPFFQSLFAQAKEIKKELGDAVLEPLEPADQSAAWVGYLLKSAGNPNAPAYAVLANPTDAGLSANVHIPALGVQTTAELPPGEGAVLRLDKGPTAAAKTAKESGYGSLGAVAFTAAVAAVAVAAALGAPWVIAHYALLSSIAGWAANVTFFFFPWVQIAANRKNLRLLKSGGTEAALARQRLSGVSALSQMTLIAGNLLNFPTFLASGSAALIGNALIGAAGSIYILSQLASGKTFPRWKWTLISLGSAAAVAAAWPILAHAWLVQAMGIAATAVFTGFTLPQILANRQALRQMKDPRSEPAARAKALENLKGIRPLYLLVGMIGNLFLVPIFMSAGRWYNVTGNAVGILGPLLILGPQLVAAKLYPKNRFAAVAAAAALWAAFFVATSIAAHTGFWK
ncbi:MAG TPA: alpha-amylase family glycosyl hydrolase [Elusimicrobiota bacterium]|nr:alpha-amylase family glycosyl hydrolase [Elusimicrobiota bacterium]